jgi:hypothetical protein
MMAGADVEPREFRSMFTKIEPQCVKREQFKDQTT